MRELFRDNPYFSAGFGLLGVGAALAGFRRGAIRILYLTQRRFLTTVEVTSKDPAFNWLIQWLTRQTLYSGSHFTINAQGAKNSSAVANFSPAPGVHYLRWHGGWIKMAREREKTAMVDITSGMPFETITLTTLGRRPQYFMEMMKEAHRMVMEQEQGKLLVYTSWAAEWRPFGNPRRKRKLDSIIFENSIKERLLNDVREFLASSNWYADRGIPYRRGYLLHGPPGGGKSSFIQALASELDYSICLLNLSEQSLSDDRLNHLLNVLPDRSILLLEDIDSAMSSVDKPHGKLTFSGLLNALDGVASSEERLIFMTTNHYDKLDPALIRPGRVDIQQLIGHATMDQARRMFERFYPQHAHLAMHFAQMMAELQVSSAAIQGHFIQFKDDPLEALNQVQCLVESTRTTSYHNDKSHLAAVS